MFMATFQTREARKEKRVHKFTFSEGDTFAAELEIVRAECLLDSKDQAARYVARVGLAAVFATLAESGR